MKTKNIFRMLLVAAALLMGANKVNALTEVETQVWPTAGTVNETPLVWGTSIPVEGSAFGDVSVGDNIRLYYTGTNGYWQFVLNNSNSEQLFWKGDTTSGDGSFDIVVDDKLLSELQSGVSLVGNGITISSISVVQLVRDTAPFNVGENIIWSDETGEGFELDWNNNNSITFSTEPFYKARSGNTVRIYAKDYESDWQIKLMVDKKTNLAGLTITDWPNGLASYIFTNWGKPEVIQSLYDDGYLEFELDETNLGELQSVEEGILQGLGFTVDKIVVYVAEPPAAYDITYDIYPSTLVASDYFVSSNPTSATAGSRVDFVINNVPEDKAPILSAVCGETTVRVSYDAENECYYFTMPNGAVTVTLSFEQYYSVTAATTTNGTVTLDGTTYHQPNTLYTFYVTPDEGFEIGTVTVTGDFMDPITPTKGATTDGTTAYSFTMPSHDVIVNVTFTEIVVKYEVTTTANPIGGGIITITDDETEFAAGDAVTFTVTPSTGYQVTSVTVNGEACTATDGIYSFTMPEEDVTITANFERQTISVTINNLYGAVTFSNSAAVEVPEGLTAYYATAVTNNNVQLTSISGNIIPANTGVVLLSSSEATTGSTEYVLNYATSAGQSISDNMLVAVGTGGYTCQSANEYVLTWHSRLVFAQTGTGDHAASVEAGQAYLEWTAPAGSRLHLSFGDSNSTGISVVKTETTGNGAIYDLRGQRVSTPGKGLYIINGKKVVIK